jgi:FkbM family methyltransferase
MVIGYHFAPSSDAARNGEAWLIETVGRDVERFIDVGANVGDWTVAVLACSPSAEGIAVEPGAEAVSQLRIRLPESVELVPAAAGAQEGTIAFYETPGAGQGSSAFRAWAGDVQHRQVNVVTIDALLARSGWDRIEFLKVDTEGYDALALAGAEAALGERRIDVVQFEYNRPWRQAGRTLAGTIAFLERFGYEVYVLRADKVEAYDYERFGEFFSYSNFVAVNPSSRAAKSLMRAQR